MRDITLLVAHPDDEILFLWAFLARAKRMICAVSDEHNQRRRWCRRRREAFAAVGKILGIETLCLNADSDFYRMGTRDYELMHFCEHVMGLIDGPVATHNPWGEYGHLDHVLMHHVARTSGHRVYVTDITCQMNWLPVRPWNLGQAVETCSLDIDLFRQLKEVYDAYHCWTWSHEPVTRTRIYALDS